MDKPEYVFLYSVKLVKVMRKCTLSCICDISFRKSILLLIFSVKNIKGESLHSGFEFSHIILSLTSCVTLPIALGLCVCVFKDICTEI